MTDDPTARRPLKSRRTGWAQWCSRTLLKLGLRPNTVSLLSLVFAGLAGAAAWWAGTGQSNAPWAFWLLAAAGIQFRLLCNLMDGLLAVEGGLKSATGELYNEIPDRLADAMILVPLGYASGCPVGVALGWAAAAGAVLTAYLRALGATLTGRHDFCGPMAKPHRMAAATLGCLAMIALSRTSLTWPVLVWLLAVIDLGIAVTCWRRVRHLAAALHGKSG